MDDQNLLKIGYIAAIVLAFLGMIASILYLFYFSYNSPMPEVIQRDTMVAYSAERRMVLLSTAIFVAMSFGFLGFALFLIQAKGDIDTSLEIKDYKLKFVRLSPGVFVILCATAIIIICSTFKITYSDTEKFNESNENQNQPPINLFDYEEDEPNLFNKYYKKDSVRTDQ